MEIKEVFEPVLNFIKNLQKKDKEFTSKQAAKDRLKLVLMQDRASVSPDFFEMMKQEIIDVIKKYIEIDEDALEVELTRGLEAGLEGPALYANIPIKNVKPVAPRAEGDDEIDELLVGSPTLSEEEAEVVADQILSQIEHSVKSDELVNDVIVSGDPAVAEEIEVAPIIAEVAKEISEMRADIEAAENGVTEEAEKVEKVEKKKTVKKAAATKSTAKKKTTTTRVTAKKTATKTTTKKKKEE